MPEVGGHGDDAVLDRAAACAREEARQTHERKYETTGTRMMATTYEYCSAEYSSSTPHFGAGVLSSVAALVPRASKTFPAPTFT